MSRLTKVAGHLFVTVTRSVIMSYAREDSVYQSSINAATGAAELQKAFYENKSFFALILAYAVGKTRQIRTFCNPHVTSILHPTHWRHKEATTGLIEAPPEPVPSHSIPEALSTHPHRSIKPLGDQGESPILSRVAEPTSLTPLLNSLQELKKLFSKTITSKRQVFLQNHKTGCSTCI